MDGQKLGWKNERELGNSSQVGEKKGSVLEDRDRLGSMCSTAQNHNKNTFCSTELNLGCSYLNISLCCSIHQENVMLVEIVVVDQKFQHC